MPAPKHNSYWKNRSKHGRLKEFPTAADLQKAWQEYFKWVDENPWYRNEQLKKPMIVKDKDGNEHLQSIIQIPTKRPYTEAGFIAFHGLGKNFIHQLEAQLTPTEENTPLTTEQEEYSGVLAWARNVCWTDKFEGAAVGAYNVSIISRDLGLRDVQDVTHKGDKENPIRTENTTRVIKANLSL
jgi:hypothetical protein